MKKLGTIKGTEYVLDKTDKASACKLVTALPEPSECEFDTVILANDSGAYMAGDKFVKQNGMWVKLDRTFVNDLQVPTDIVASRVGNEVSIRWTDPEDTPSTAWKHTRILRKYGDVPKDEYDGVVVTDSYVRNFYSGSQSNVLKDYLPEGLEHNWQYKLFVFSTNEIAKSTSSADFIAYDVDWNNLQDRIREGLAPKVFCLGDSIVLGSGEMELEIVAFDQANMYRAPGEARKQHSITLIGTVAAPSTIWDTTWGDYRLITENTIVTNANKKYYTYNVSTNKYVQVYFGIGQTIEGVVDNPSATPIYEEVTIPDRKNYPGNNWKRSVVRQWLNSKDLTHVTGINEPCILSRLFQLEPRLENLITKVTNVTACSDVDGGNRETTVDTLYLLSITEVFGQENKIGYTDSGAILIEENPQMPYFSDEANRRREDAAGASTTWWLRSPNYDETNVVHSVKINGDMDPETRTSETHNIVFALTIGG